MTRWKVLAVGLPAWTLGYLLWWILSVPQVGNTLGGPVGMTPDHAAQVTAAQLDYFYFQQLPKLAVWLGGYVVLTMLSVRAPRPRIGLVAVWVALVIVCAIVGRPLPVEPYG